jgi:hypothetical protein
VIDGLDFEEIDEEEPLDKDDPLYELDLKVTFLDYQITYFLAFLYFFGNRNTYKTSLKPFNVAISIISLNWQRLACQTPKKKNFKLGLFVKPIDKYYAEMFRVRN